MPLLPPVDYMAPVPLKRKRGTSAEPKTGSSEGSIHAHTRRGEAVVRGLLRLSRACPWQDTRLQHSPGEASGAGALRGPWHPTRSAGGTMAGAPNAAGRPPVELPLFVFSRLANLTHAVAAMLSPQRPHLAARHRICRERQLLQLRVI